MFLPFDPQIPLMEIYPNEMQVKLFVMKYFWQCCVEQPKLHKNTKVQDQVMSY